MNQESLFGGVNLKLAPLISFYSIIDIDFGLINLIYDQYLDESVFKKDFFERTPIEIIRDIYNRRDINPLYLISKDNISKELLDQYYKEFIENKMDDILRYSISTEILNLIDSFNQSKDVMATILCYNKMQIDLLNQEHKLANNKKILLSSLDDKGKDKYVHFFFKNVDEVETFKKLRNKDFYFSSSYINLDERNDLCNSKLIDEIIHRSNTISIFDMYKENVLGRKQKDE